MLQHSDSLSDQPHSCFSHWAVSSARKCLPKKFAIVLWLTAVCAFLCRFFFFSVRTLTEEYFQVPNKTVICVYYRLNAFSILKFSCQEVPSISSFPLHTSGVYLQVFICALCWNSLNTIITGGSNPQQRPFDTSKSLYNHKQTLQFGNVCQLDSC